MVKDADFTMYSRKKLSEAVFRAASKLKLLQLTSAGYNVVDLPLMAELGIPVATVGGANSQGVAEMAITLMLSLYRRLICLDMGVRRGKWRKALISGFDTFELAEKTVGIVGFGYIGKLVARRLRGFDCNILYYDIVAYPEAEKELDAKRVGLDHLLTESDVVTIHAPLTDNAGLIGKHELALMKPSAILINTARGRILDEPAFIDAFRDGAIAGGGLDVFQEEPINPDNELLTMGNVVLTPHAAGSTCESWS
jgi:phosphoglycerate dehydrogenase-like enzyme